MNPDIIVGLVHKLRVRREQVSDTIALLTESSRPVELDQTTQGRLSRMDAIAQQQMAKAGKTHLQIELRRIDAALDRVVKQTFGRCCRCELDIDIERLNADAAVPFCMDCYAEISAGKQRQELANRR